MIETLTVHYSIKVVFIPYLVRNSLLAWEWHQTAKDQSGRLCFATSDYWLHSTRKLSVAAYGQSCKYTHTHTISGVPPCQVICYESLKWKLSFKKPSDYTFVCRVWFVSSLQVGGVIVDVNLSEHSATIRFSEYHDGAAPFLIINHTKDQTLHFHQRWESRRSPRFSVSVSTKYFLGRMSMSVGSNWEREEIELIY